MKIKVDIILIFVAIVLCIIICLIYVGNDKIPSKFKEFDKVSYIDDSGLIGRIIAVNEYRNSKARYRVRWLFSRVKTKFLGGNTHQSLFTKRVHEERDLVLVEGY